MKDGSTGEFIREYRSTEEFVREYGSTEELIAQIPKYMKVHVLVLYWLSIYFSP